MPSTESVSANVLPRDGVTITSGASVSSFSVSMSRNPLNTDSTHTMAAVATAMPHIDTAEMAVTALCDFLANR